MADAKPVHAKTEDESDKKVEDTPKLPPVPPVKKKPGKIELRDNQGPPVPGETYKLPDGTIVSHK